jgi:hypothetical protein
LLKKVKKPPDHVGVWKGRFRHLLMRRLRDKAGHDGEVAAEGRLVGR